MSVTTQLGIFTSITQNFRHPLHKQQKMHKNINYAWTPDPCPGQGSGANCVTDVKCKNYFNLTITEGVCVKIEGVSIICVIDIKCVICVIIPLFA